MTQFLLSTPAQLVIWLTVLVILVALGGYIVGRLRDQSDDERQTANELLTNFRDLHDQGDIAATEFRKIKTVLGVQLQMELLPTRPAVQPKPDLGGSSGSGSSGCSDDTSAERDAERMESSGGSQQDDDSNRSDLP